MKRILTYILLFLVFSCGQTNEEEIADAIAEANLLLSDRRCSEALQVMLAVEVQPRNKDYVDTLATAFACIGNYSTTTLFATDFTNLNTTAGGFFGSLAAFSTSDDMTTPDDTDFVSLQLAIDVLLYAGGFTSAAATNRATVFNSSDATDINLQAFYMIIVNMGRWFRYYGNTNSAGLKGAGGEPNTCLATYTDNAVGGAIPAISLGGTGSCTNAANTGHVDIETGDSDERKVRLCQGIILFNNFIDTISNLTFVGADASDLNTVKTVFSAACTIAAAVPTTFDSDLCNARDLAACITFTDNDIERYVTRLFETGLQ